MKIPPFETIKDLRSWYCKLDISENPIIEITEEEEKKLKELFGHLQNVSDFFRPLIVDIMKRY